MSKKNKLTPDQRKAEEQMRKDAPHTLGITIGIGILILIILSFFCFC